MSGKRPWLFFLGKRRPTSLADHAQYSEVQHDKATPKKGKLPKGVEGQQLGRGSHRRADGK